METQTQTQIMQEAIDKLNAMSDDDFSSTLIKAGIADTTNSINANSDAFKKALLRTQTKHADIIKALEDK
ncbi:hypothetical protein KKJ17_18615 [Xenorhabdus bovienii]|uniref:hypothetical protein n=1 Tax=Xenorhabdus bovienii TaxID=40576 RepID=UPI00237D2087|nr:hypothetical protein [Xenorhabdus bovienii]MDE1483458.1 hypothetical protein [Xenorhabdus bovienii]MDE9443764.1 hypothetical protein [Xenorhabdus bovienii]MDE9519673.1 hypothetical protein [Xenorhabdus bovienii]MDE9538141.1 hypothetical protein [Xenorhabdus bovienii]MDE9549498.1 hypothetical protein [Xenorhabdus bovienii]